MATVDVRADLDVRFNSILKLGAQGVWLSATNAFPIASDTPAPTDKDVFWHPGGREWFGYDSVLDKWVGREQTLTMFGFGNQATYTANQWARWTNLTTNLNWGGIPFYHDVVVDRIIAVSNGNIPVPASGAGIQVYKNGTLQGTAHNWGGSTYYMDNTINVLYNKYDTINFQYIDPPLTQSAGKTAGYVTYRKWRI